MTKIMTAIDIARLSGIIEGEGWMGYYAKSRSIQVRVNMTDEDVVRWLRDATGVGSIHGPYTPARRRVDGGSYKPQWCWSVSSYRDVIRILTAIAPLMGERRRSKILEMATIAQSLRAPKTCKHCELSFIADGRRTHYCTTKCLDAEMAERKRTKYHAAKNP